MKQLTFDVKYNLKRAPRIYVKSSDSKLTYGSFSADHPSNFEGWGQLNDMQRIELTHYIQNLNAVKNHLGVAALSEQTDYRFRLPLSFIQAIDDISALAQKESAEIDIFEPIVASIIQQLKIAVAKLTGEHKRQALGVLDKLGLAEYKKLDYTLQIQSIFAELLSILNKSEKLHEKAKALFNKDKSYSPKAIEGMAKGETLPSRWLVACAIDILANEKSTVLRSLLSEDDIFMLWAKPLIDHDQIEKAEALAKKYSFDFVKEKLSLKEH